MNRQKTEIIGQVLELAQQEVNISTLIRKANLPTNRLQLILENLTSSGLIVKIDKNWVITSSGRIYLAEYQKFYKLASAYGLEL